MTKKLASQVDGFCVSNMDEAPRNREVGLQHPILILGVVPSETVSLAKEHDIRLTVASLAWLDQLLGEEADLSGLEDPYQGGFWNGADWIPNYRRDQRG